MSNTFSKNSNNFYKVKASQIDSLKQQASRKGNEKKKNRRLKVKQLYRNDLMSKVIFNSYYW